MPDLTSKQLIFCREYFGGKTATQAAIEAGYAFKTARSAGSRLLTKGDITEYLTELQQKADDASVATVLERKQILTAILRGRLATFVTDEMTTKILDDPALKEIAITRYGRTGDETIVTTVKLNDPVKAIDLLNKMERIYGEVGILVDNRVLNITVASEKGADMVRRIAAGEGTGKEQDNGKTDDTEGR